MYKIPKIISVGNKRNLKLKALLIPKMLSWMPVVWGLLALIRHLFPLLFSEVLPENSELLGFDGSCAAEKPALLNTDPSAPAYFKCNLSD